MRKKDNNNSEPVDEQEDSADAPQSGDKPGREDLFSYERDPVMLIAHDPDPSSGAHFYDEMTVRLKSSEAQRIFRRDYKHADRWIFGLDRTYIAARPREALKFAEVLDAKVVGIRSYYVTELDRVINLGHRLGLAQRFESTEGVECTMRYTSPRTCDYIELIRLLDDLCICAPAVQAAWQPDFGRSGISITGYKRALRDLDIFLRAEYNKMHDSIRSAERLRAQPIGVSSHF
jgi:hypothetical protein